MVENLQMESNGGNRRNIKENVLMKGWNEARNKRKGREIGRKRKKRKVTRRESGREREVNWGGKR